MLGLPDVTFFGCLVAVLVVYVAYRVRQIVNWFDDRNIPNVPLQSPLGSDWRLGSVREHIGWDRMYKRLAPHKIGGFFMYLQPIVLVRDPEYVHQVYVSGFSHFVDRGFTVDEKKDPLDGHLFFINGGKWKYLRSKLSPIFTSGKLRWMFEQMKGSSDKFVDNFERKVSLSKDVDLKEDYARFTTDVISSCAFGIDSNSMGDPDSRFRDMGKKFFDPSIFENLKLMARFTMPQILIWLKIRTTSVEITDFFLDVVKQAFNHRLSTGIIRKDFIQLLLELREKGFVRSDDDVAKEPEPTVQNGVSKSHTKEEEFVIDDGSLTAQLFVFFAAGFETTSNTLYNLTYLLSRNKQCQEKAREEALKVLGKNGGTWTYDCIKDLTYLSQCISETLRMLPPVPTNFRICTDEFTFPDGTTIEKGTRVILPTFSLHYDPQYFPEPTKFKPERFETAPVNGSYAPFGDGPRICIGKRFAEVEMKLTMAKLLCKYKFEPASKETDIFNWNRATPLLSLNEPSLVRVEKL